ncbi:hypothetical protein SNEBB_000756, partial [Seison nebaliae]
MFKLWSGLYYGTYLTSASYLLLEYIDYRQENEEDKRKSLRKSEELCKECEKIISALVEDIFLYEFNIKEENEELSHFFKLAMKKDAEYSERIENWGKFIKKMIYIQNSFIVIISIFNGLQTIIYSIIALYVNMNYKNSQNQYPTFILKKIKEKFLNRTLKEEKNRKIDDRRFLSNMENFMKFHLINLIYTISIDSLSDSIFDITNRLNEEKWIEMIRMDKLEDIRINHFKLKDIDMNYEEELCFMYSNELTKTFLLDFINKNIIQFNDVRRKLIEELSNKINDDVVPQLNHSLRLYKIHENLIETLKLSAKEFTNKNEETL